MADLSLGWQSDLEIGPGGDFVIASGAQVTKQRVVRRLFTNPGEYIWQLDYGAGVGQYVGRPIQPLHLRAVIRGQMFKEAMVARTPEPSISLDNQPGIGAGILNLSIRYFEASAPETQVLDLPVAG